MNRFQRFYHNHIEYLWDGERFMQKIQTPVSAISSFLWLGVVLILLGLVSLVGLALFSYAKKDFVVQTVKNYGDTFFSQLPEVMTGVLQKENQEVVFHMNHDTPIVFHLGRTGESLFSIHVDTSRSDMQDLDEGITIRKHGFGIIKDNAETRWFNFEEMTQQYGLFSGSANEKFDFSMKQIKSSPALLSTLMKDNRTTILWTISIIGLVWILFFGGFLLFCYMLWYLILHAMIWLCSILIPKVSGGVTSDVLWQIIVRCSFVPFLVYSVIDMPYYVYIILGVLYVSFVNRKLTTYSKS